MAGQESITLHHLLTHTAGIFAPPDIAPYRCDLATLKRRLFAGEIGDWRPGDVAAYDTWGGWYALAEIIERVTGSGWAEFLTDRVLKPVDADRLDFRPGDRDAVELPYRSLGSRVFPLKTLDRPEAITYDNPGYGGYAPMSALAELYRVLGDRDRFVDTFGFPPDRLCTPQRPVRYDPGLGLACALAYGTFTGLRPWRYTDRIFPGAFGLHSNAGTWGFCDPAARLVVALRINGMRDGLYPAPPPGDPRGPAPGHPRHLPAMSSLDRPQCSHIVPPAGRAKAGDSGTLSEC